MKSSLKPSKGVLFIAVVAIAGAELHSAPSTKAEKGKGVASWYGEAHRGKPMANGKPFDPNQLTAASWFYPIGTVLKVSVVAPTGTQRSVTVTVSDRGPAKRLVRQGRIIDLSSAAFKALAVPEQGLTRVKVDLVTMSTRQRAGPG